MRAFPPGVAIDVTKFRLWAGFGLLGFIWGSEWLATRQIAMPPLRALALRYGIAAVLLAAFAVLLRLRRPSLRELWLLALGGVGLLGLPAILISWAAGRVSPGLLVVLLAMTPLLAALIEGRAAGALMVPLIGAVAGTAWIAAQGLSFATGQWPGALAALAAAALIAASVAWWKRRLSGTPPVLTAALQLGAAAVIVAGASVGLEGASDLAIPAKSVGWELGLAVAAHVIAYPLYFWILGSSESHQVTASQWLVTAVGVIEGLLLVREVPSWRMASGAAVVLASLVAVWRTNDAEQPLTLEITRE